MLDGLLGMNLTSAGQRMEDVPMSDQVQNEPEDQASHEADIDAGYDDSSDRDEGSDVTFAPAGVPHRDLDDEQSDTSHDADVAEGYDDQTSEEDSAT
jgi:hypothetical protein